MRVAKRRKDQEDQESDNDVSDDELVVDEESPGHSPAHSYSKDRVKDHPETPNSSHSGGSSSVGEKPVVMPVNNIIPSSSHVVTLNGPSLPAVVSGQATLKPGLMGESRAVKLT